MRIYKYILKGGQVRQQLTIPASGQVISACMQRQGIVEEIVVYVKFDDLQLINGNVPLRSVWIRVHGTGHIFDEAPGTSLRFIDTVKLDDGLLMLHVFEEVEQSEPSITVKPILALACPNHAMAAEVKRQVEQMQSLGHELAKQYHILAFISTESPDIQVFTERGRLTPIQVEALDQWRRQQQQQDQWQEVELTVNYMKQLQIGDRIMSPDGTKLELTITSLDEQFLIDHEVNALLGNFNCKLMRKRNENHDTH